jgi:hypothetical protein
MGRRYHGHRYRHSPLRPPQTEVALTSHLLYLFPQRFTRFNSPDLLLTSQKREVNSIVLPSIFGIPLPMDGNCRQGDRT